MGFARLSKSGGLAPILAVAILLVCVSSCTMRPSQVYENQSSASPRDTSLAQAEVPPSVMAEQTDSTQLAKPAPPAIADDDGDGVADLHDHCRDTPRGATVDEMGCPHDTDGDGVYDGIDKCPGTMAVVGMIIDSTGCPSDADHDGVPDHHDLCPDTPPDVSVTPQGCPIDTDGDGVPDHADKCPDTPGGTDVNASGCEPDSDGDGIPDPQDQCPHTPKGLEVDATGCLVMTQVSRRLILYVNYVPGTTDPDAMSLRILDDVAIRMEHNPGVIAVVEGFTDNIGIDSANAAVSQKRADKVAKYLEKKGVPASRIESYGRGEAHFIADNATAAGRQKNRRIEISFRAAN